jgi:hypothetical protein
VSALGVQIVLLNAEVARLRFDLDRLTRGLEAIARDARVDYHCADQRMEPEAMQVAGHLAEIAEALLAGREWNDGGGVPNE